MRTWLLVALAAVACERPCDPITESPTAERLGVVLEGGRLCKQDDLVMTVEYPDERPEALAPAYARRLAAAGWKAEQVAPTAVLAARGADSLFIVTGKDEKQRRVPFAVVRYCSDPGCRTRLEELAAGLRRRAPD